MYLAEYVLPTIYLEKNQREIVMYDETQRFDSTIPNFSISPNYNFTKTIIRPEYYLTDFVDFEFYYKLRKAAEAENNVILFETDFFKDQLATSTILKKLIWQLNIMAMESKFILVNEKFYYDFIKRSDYSYPDKKDKNWAINRQPKLSRSLYDMNFHEEIIYTSIIPYNRIFVMTERSGIMAIKDANSSKPSFAIDIFGKQVVCGVLLDLI